MMDVEESDRHYTRGSQRAWLTMLSECIRQLGYDYPEATDARWILERADVVMKLREICEEYGDNEWPDDLHLSDVIEKHLWRNLPILLEHNKG